MADPTPPTNPAAAGAAIGGSTGTTAPGSGPPPAPAADVLAPMQAQAAQIQARLDDHTKGYNKQIDDLTAALNALDKTDIDYAKNATALNQQIQAQATLRNQDLNTLKAWNDQINAELDRRQRAARESGVLTPREQQALDAQTALAKRQQEHIDAQMQQEAAAAARAADPTNLALAQAESDATTRATNAKTAYQETQNAFAAAGFQQALDSGAQQLEEGRRVLAAGGPEAGVSLTSAQANAEQAQADATAQATREHQRGALGTFIDQVTATAAAGLITQAEAERQIAAFAQAQATGATPYEWQQQADTNARQVATAMIQSGQMVGPNQQYVAGGEPGGILEQAAARWGFKAPAVQLHPTGAPAYMQSLGMTVGTPQGGAPVQGGPPAYMQSLTPPTVQDWSGHDLAQLHATLTGATPAASPSNVQLPVATPAGAQMGGVNNGLALGPIITGAPNYARLPGT